MTGWRDASNRVAWWILGTIFSIVVAFALGDRMSIGKAIEETSGRVTVVEQNYVTKDVLHAHEEDVQKQINDSVKEIIKCLNQIQRDQVCDL